MRKADKKLEEAIIKNDLEQVKKLLNAFWPFMRANIESKNTKITNPPLYVAAREGHVEIIEYLLSQGANINATNDCGFTALDSAILSRKMAAFSCLLKHGANIETRSASDTTPSINAAYFGQDAMLLELIIRGADINAKDYEGNTALHRAIQNKKIGCINILLEHGANIEDSKNNPLIWAPLVGDPEIIKLLLKKGANINATDADGNTALLCALMKINHNSSEERREVVKILIENGADTSIKNNKGESADTWAIENAKDEASKSILKKKQNKQDITHQDIADLKVSNPIMLNTLIVTGKLLETLKEQPYEEQIKTYKIVKDILPEETKKAFEKHIRNTRLKMKATKHEQFK